MSFYDMSFPNSLCFLVTSPLIPQDFLKPQLVFQGFFEKEELVHLFKSVHGTGEITQELISLTILPEDLGSVQSINMAPSCKGSIALLQSRGVAGMWMAPRHNTHTHRIKEVNLKAKCSGWELGRTFSKLSAYYSSAR